MLIILYLGGSFLPGKLLFLTNRNLRHLRIGYLVDTLVCNFFSFILFHLSSGNISRPRLMDAVHSICYQKNILSSGLLESILSVFLLHCSEQMFPKHFWIILMPKMQKKKNQNWKKRPALISVTRKLQLSRDKCLYSQSYYPCAKFGMI